ncbi:MAG: c-type cytochrome biogenesis protein CcsB, partial [Candidatus Nanopelagicaceae bacterium]|nr:c-type cytochrome biogenesis protein CcsB [Candidatus Nanopelagicaceae bacterium]
MTKTDWAYVSNDLVYGALFIYTISFIFYTYET